jgi:hypothetical protein
MYNLIISMYYLFFKSYATYLLIVKSQLFFLVQPILRKLRLGRAIHYKSSFRCATLWAFRYYPLHAHNPKTKKSLQLSS